MLTVPGLCWLCRMPLALGHWGFVRYAHAPPVQIKRYAPMWITRHTLTSSLRSLPAKPPPRQRLVTVADYAPPLSPLIHQLKFSRRSEIASAPHVCYYWKSYTLVAPPGCNCRIALSAFRYGSGVTGVGDLIRAICCVSRYHAGCTADGIAKPSHEHGPLRPSIFSVPGCASAT